MMNKNNTQKYHFVCTLTFGDIYGQIIVWLITITISLASALALMGAKRPVYALATVGLVVLLSLPFLLFAFVTTLFNHIEVRAVSTETKTEPIPGNISQQQPVQAAS
jgi:energy-coupling factor transporter transmembrane protein EcfT